MSTSEPISPPPPLPHPPGVRWPRVFAILLAVSAAGLILHLAPPHQNPWYPQCVLHRLTGLHCPGCGMTRGVYWLGHGEWLLAVRSNLLLVVALPGVLWGVWRYGVPWLQGRPVPSPTWRPRTVVLLLGVMALFGIVRNLPFSPCRWLIPPDLPAKQNAHAPAHRSTVRLMTDFSTKPAKI